jgi:CheY-like chemotaxis protein
MFARLRSIRARSRLNRVKRPSILVVDAHRDCRESLELALDLAGCEVHAVGSGHDALVHLRSWTPDAVVLDSHVGEVPALHVARVLRANARFDLTRLVMTCTWQRPELRRQARAAGVDALWMKPFAFTDLVQVVKGEARQR